MACPLCAAVVLEDFNIGAYECGCEYFRTRHTCPTHGLVYQVGDFAPQGACRELWQARPHYPIAA